MPANLPKPEDILGSKKLPKPSDILPSPEDIFGKTEEISSGNFGQDVANTLMPKLPLASGSADSKSSGTTIPKTNLESLTEINRLAQDRVKVSKTRLDAMKRIKQLEPELKKAQSELSALEGVYNDTGQPPAARNEAAARINQIINSVKPADEEYSKLVSDYHDLVYQDKKIVTDVNKIEKIRQMNLEKEYSFVQNALERTGEGMISAAAGVAGIFNTLGLSGDTEGGNDYDQEEVRVQTRENIQKMRDFGKSLITQETPKEWEHMFKGKMSAKKLAFIAENAIAQTAPTVAAGVLTGGAGTALVGAGMGFNESKDILKDAGLNEEESDWAALGLSVPIGLLEKYGADDVVKVLSNPTLKKEIAKDLAIKIAGKNLAKDAIANEAKNSMGKVILRQLKDVGSTALKEASTEVAQGELQEVAKQTAQEITGVDNDENMSTSDYLMQQLTQRGEEAVSGAIAGGGLSAAAKGVSSAVNRLKITPTTYQQVKEFDIPEKFEEFQADLAQEVQDGIITPEQAQEAIKNVEKVKQADQAIPDTIEDTIMRAEAVNLIMEKQQLETEIDGKDKALIVPQTERIKEIDQQLTDIATGKYAEQNKTEEAPKASAEPETDSNVLNGSTESTVETEVKDIENTRRVIDSLPESEAEDIANLNTLDNYDVVETEIPDGFVDQDFWQEKLVEKALLDNGVKFSKHGSKSSGSSYYTISLNDGEFFKVRVSDHPVKYGTDANIQFDETTTPEDILGTLRDQLPDGKILKNTSVADEYHKQKGYKAVTNKKLVNAVEGLLLPKQEETEPVQDYEVVSEPQEKDQLNGKEINKDVQDNYSLKFDITDNVVKSNKVKSSVLLKEAVDRSDNDAEKQMLTQLFERASKNDVDVFLVPELSETPKGANAVYDYKNNAIQIHPKVLTSNEKDFRRIVAHEFVHALTFNTINEWTRTYKDSGKIEVITDGISENQEKFVNDIISLYNEAKSTVKGEHYGLKNVHEFLSESLTNPAFQKALRTGNVWQKLVNVLKDFLGIKVDNEMLDKVLSATYDFIDSSETLTPPFSKERDAFDKKKYGETNKERAARTDKELAEKRKATNPDQHTEGNLATETPTKENPTTEQKLQDIADEKGLDSFRKVVNTVNKYEREVAIDQGETITPEEVDNALKNKEAGKVRDGYVTEDKSYRVSGIKKALVPEEKVTETEIERRTTKQMLDLGKELVDNEEISPRAIIEEINDKPRALQPQEVAALVYYKAKLDNKFDKVLDKISEAKKTDDIDSELIARAELSVLQKDLEDYHEMAVKTAYEQSLAFSLRKAMLDSEYSLQSQINRYKAINNGVIPNSVQEKFEEYDQQIKELNKQIQALQEQKEKDEGQISVDNIKESVDREYSLPKIKPILTEKERARKKELANKFLNRFNDITGVAQLIADKEFYEYSGLVFKETAGEFAAFAKQIMATAGKGLKDALPELYKSLGGKGDTVFEQESTFIQDGKLLIPKPLIRELVAAGYDNIDVLTNEVYNRLHEDLPDVTHRQVRDAITNYGKTVNLSQEEINVKLREINRMGKLLSALEDVQNKKRPLRSGLQRDKLTQEERRLQKVIKEGMKELPFSEEDAKKAWATSLDAVKSRLNNQISDLEKQIATGEKTPKKKGVEYDAEANALKDKRDALKKVIEEVEGKPKMSDEQRLRAAISTVQTSVDELERRIKEKDFTIKEKAAAPVSEILDNLKNQRKLLRDVLTEMEREAGITDKRRLDNKKKALQRSIGFYNRKIETGDYNKKAKRSPVKPDDAAKKLEIEKLLIKEKFDVEVEKARRKNRPWTEKLREVYSDIIGIPKSLQSTLDFSAPLRQGAVLSYSNPKIAAKAFIEMFKYFASEKQQQAFINDLKVSDDYRLVVNSKLYLSQPNTRLAAKEEEFVSNFAQRIPIYGKAVKASERAYTGYLNYLRFNVFSRVSDTMINNGYDPDKDIKPFKDLASYINNATGRGDLGALEKTADLLNTAFFSPRYVASRLNLIYPPTYLKMDKYVRKEALRSTLTYFGMVGLLQILWAISHSSDSDDDDPFIELNPLSSDFLKLRLGKKRFDISAGFGPILVFLARMAPSALPFLGGVKSIPDKNNPKKRNSNVEIIYYDGRIKKKDGEIDYSKQEKSGPYTPSRQKTAGRFIRSKASPAFSLIWDLAEGETFDGSKTSETSPILKDLTGLELPYSEEVLNKAIPLYVGDYYEIAEEDGYLSAALTMTPSMFGVGVQNYKEKEKKKPEILR
jgi:hypothetical protein